ncbi:MAG: hypothetical protein IPL22_01995 [Bacteroidetes bacterium]|nr:hypothetical protein [Bacteroidota bacterium]
MKLLDKVLRNNPVIIILLIIYVLVPGISYSQQTDSDTTESKSVYHFRKWAVPGVLLATGLYILTDDAQIDRFEIVEEQNEYLPGFQNKLDNYLQFALQLPLSACRFPELKVKMEPEIWFLNLLKLN